MDWPELSDHLGEEISAAQLVDLRAFCDLLLERNQTTNLTRIVDPDEVREKHVLDSLLALPCLGEQGPLAPVSESLEGFEPYYIVSVQIGVQGGIRRFQ